VLVPETYTRNAGGEPSKVLREDGSYTLYEYDAALKLSKEVVYNPAGGLVESIDYSYDLDGKRTKKVDAAGTHNYNYNPNGQLATVGQDSYIYDVDGRLSQFNRDGKAVVLSHDAIDHLTQVSVNGVNTQYLYDAQGNRIGEVSGGNTKNYLVAPNLGNGLESTDLVTDGNGNVVSDYVYGGSSIIARLDSNGEPIYYLTDSMGSVIGLVDGNGDRVSRIVYDGFGEVKSGDDGTSLGGDFRFQGQWLETESGLYYMRARDYDAKTGLFLSRDAVDVQEQGVEAFNPYHFAFNNPLIYSDPTGLFSLSELNVTNAIRNILDSVQRYSQQQVRDFVFNKSGEAITAILKRGIEHILPLTIDEQPILNAFNNKGGKKPSQSLEEIVVKGLCGIFNNIPKDAFRFDVKYNSSNVTRAISDGESCDDTISKGIRNPGGGRVSIDYMIKPTPPTQFKRDGWLVGDFKTSVAKLHLSYVKRQPKGFDQGKQWGAITQHAKRYQFVPITMFITWNPDEKSKVKTAELERLAISSGVAMIIVSLKK
jgi:RHS repeat-associated protein